MLRRDDGHFMRPLDLRLMTKGRKRTWKKQVEEESMKVGLSREEHIADER